MDKNSELIKKGTISLGWLFWIQMIVILIAIKSFGLIGGLIAWLTWSFFAFIFSMLKPSKPKEMNNDARSNIAQKVEDIADTTNRFLTGATDVMEDVRHSLELFNYKSEKTQHIRDEIHQINLLKARPKASLKYADSDDERQKFRSQIAMYDAQIALLNEEILEIERQCAKEFPEKESRRIVSEVTENNTKVRMGKDDIALKASLLPVSDELSSSHGKNADNDQLYKWMMLAVLGVVLAICFIYVFDSYSKDPLQVQEDAGNSLGVEKFEISVCDEPLWTTARSLVVRDSPNPQANKVGSLPFNSKICVQGSSNGWVKIPQGWVSSRYTQASPVADKPLVDVSDTAKPITQDMLGPNPVWSYKNWELHYIGDEFLYFTHGRKVYVHQFGMIKKKGLCSYDHLWLTMSSFKSLPSEDYSKSIWFEVNVDDVYFPMADSTPKCDTL